MGLFGGPVLDTIPGKYHFECFIGVPLRTANGILFIGVTVAFEPLSTYEQLQGLTVPSDLVRKKSALHHIHQSRPPPPPYAQAPLAWNQNLALGCYPVLCPTRPR